jgi:hypothetical protein
MYKEVVREYLRHYFAVYMERLKKISKWGKLKQCHSQLHYVGIITLFNATHFGFFYKAIMGSTKGLSYKMHRLYYNQIYEISTLQTMYKMDAKTGKITQVNYKNKLCIFCIVQVRYKVEISTVYYDIIYAMYRTSFLQIFCTDSHWLCRSRDKWHQVA